MSFQFCPSLRTCWDGRYARIEGDSSVFHVEFVNGHWWPTIKWKIDGALATCIALQTDAVGKLTNGVNSAKQAMGASSCGGSFVINEYGQVIVPARDGGGNRMLVGTISGKFLFEDPFDEDDVIDLSDVDGMHCGDDFCMPYVGIPFHLSKGSKIYFFMHDNEGGHSIYPPLQDHNLIALLRKVRRYGAVRFIVNPYGLVATKKPPDGAWAPEEHWTPVYVGKIDYSKWFTKE